MFNLLKKMLMNRDLAYWSTINVGPIFRQHVSTICQKAYRSTNVLFRCFNTDNANDALIRGYTPFVRPLLEYCSTVWNPFIHAKYNLGMTDELENIQRHFTRRLYYRCRLDCNHLERINHLQLESLELRRIYNHAIHLSSTELRALDMTHSNLIKWSLGLSKFCRTTPLLRALGTQKIPAMRDHQSVNLLKR